jgi:putative tricarboxylic transport membrane protein
VNAAQRTALLRAGGMFAIGVLYIAAVPYIGYILAIALLIAATTYYQGGRLSRQTGVVAVGGAVFFWVMFVWLLRIPQPPGLWPDLF